MWQKQVFQHFQQSLSQITLTEMQIEGVTVTHQLCMYYIFSIF